MAALEFCQQAANHFEPFLRKYISKSPIIETFLYFSIALLRDIVGSLKNIGSDGIFITKIKMLSKSQKILAGRLTGINE